MTEILATPLAVTVINRWFDSCRLFAVPARLEQRWGDASLHCDRSSI